MSTPVCMLHNSMKLPGAFTPSTRAFTDFSDFTGLLGGCLQVTPSGAPEASFRVRGRRGVSGFRLLKVGIHMGIAHKEYENTSNNTMT